jgi:hypothetical protein
MKLMTLVQFRLFHIERVFVAQALIIRTDACQEGVFYSLKKKLLDFPELRQFHSSSNLAYPSASRSCMLCVK